MQHLDHPDPIALHIFVLEYAFGPRGALAVLAEQAEVAPPTVRLAAARIDVNDGLKLIVLVETTPRHGLAAVHATQILADALAPDVHAVGADLESGIRREEIGCFLKQRAVHVETVCALQMLDGARGFETLYL